MLNFLYWILFSFIIVISVVLLQLLICPRCSTHDLKMINGVCPLCRNPNNLFKALCVGEAKLSCVETDRGNFYTITLLGKTETVLIAYSFEGDLLQTHIDPIIKRLLS